MATKKKSTASTTTSKHYIVLDDDRDIVCEGSWGEVLVELEEILEDNNWDGKVISDFTVHELGIAKKIKFTPARIEL